MRMPWIVHIVSFLRSGIACVLYQVSFRTTSLVSFFVLLQVLFCLSFSAQSLYAQSASHTDILTIRGNFVQANESNVLLNTINFEMNLIGGKRYMIVAFGGALDTTLEVVYQDIRVFRDIFLLEDAGAIISPSDDGRYFFSVKNVGVKPDDSIIVEEFEPYEIDVDQLHIPPTLVSRFPFSESASLDEETILIHKIAKEYEVVIPAQRRLFVSALSPDLDIVLELYDEYGRTLYADFDNMEPNSEILSLYSEQESRYFVQVRPFFSEAMGSYSITMEVSTGELLNEYLDNVGDTDIVAFGNYGKRYELALKAGEYRAVELKSYNETLELLFTDADLTQIGPTRVYTPGDQSTLTLLVPSDGDYSLFVLKKTGSLANYLLKIYR